MRFDALPLWLRGAGALAALYAIAAVLWYGGTPLGRMPVLDGREMLDLARAIAAGTLPHEPFYRAPLYPALLALPVALGLDPASLPVLARVVNLGAHFASALLIGALARRLGAGERAAFAGTLAWLVYPVALHFSGDPLDVSLGIALALGGTLFAMRAADGGPAAVRAALGAAALLGAATLARPQFLAMLVAWGGVLAWRAARGGARAPLVAYAGAAGALLAAMGCVNLAVGSEFRVLPWQSTYALWAANRPESNHRYYTQIVQVRDVARNENPIRLEAELLWRRETGATGALDIGAFNRHWSQRLRERVQDAPLAVASGIAQHAAYLVHDAEQYDNKTYAFHKQASPWLRHNPLGFGVVLCAALAALALAPGSLARRGVLLALALYAAGSVLFIVTDKYRLPIAAFLLPIAATALSVPRKAWRRPLAWVALAAGAIVAFRPGPAADAAATFIQDELLAAQAAGDLGDYAASERLAQSALAREPERSIGWELVCNARYNQMLAALPALAPEAAWQAQAQAACLHPAVLSSQAHALGGVFLWRAGQRDAARATWRRVHAEQGPGTPWAQAFLVAIGDLAPADAPDGELTLTLALARALRGDTTTRARLVAAHGALPVELELQRLRALLLLSE